MIMEGQLYEHTLNGCLVLITEIDRKFNMMELWIFDDEEPEVVQRGISCSLFSTYLSEGYYKLVE